MAGGLAVLMALIQGSEHLAVGNGLFALIVLLVYVGLQQLEASVLQPRIMGRSVELPGIVIIVGIMAGASVAGILGAYLAVPIMATARLVFLYVHTKLTEEPGIIDGSCSVAAEQEVARSPDAPHVTAEGRIHFPPARAAGEPTPTDTSDEARP